MPRIVFIGPVPPPYMGPTLATDVVLNSRLKDEFELIHLDTSDHRPLDTLGAVDFTNVYLAVKSYFVLFWILLAKWPRIVYVPISQTTVGYLRDSGYIILSRIFGRKVVCHLRGGFFKEWLDDASFATRWYVGKVHSAVDAQIVLGHCLKPLFSNVVDDERLFVVPNGKDVVFPDHACRAAGPLRVLYLGNMVRTKGVMDVLHSVSEVVRNYQNVEYILAGAWTEPDTRKKVEAFLAANRQLPIRFIGETKGGDKLSLLANADVFVFPSYYPPEGHPWVIVEAMAAGLPIITTNQGAIRESVIDGKNGFIIEKQDSSQISEKVLLLLRDEQLRRRMGMASRKLFEDHLTESCMVENLANTFRVVLNSQSTSGEPSKSSK